MLWLKVNTGHSVNNQILFNRGELSSCILSGRTFLGDIAESICFALE